MNLIDINYNVSGITDPDSRQPLREFVDTLSSMDTSLKQSFKHGLIDKLHDFSSLLLNTQQGKGDFLPIYARAVSLLDFLAQTHPEILEEVIPDLKKMKEKNRQILVSDCLKLSSQFAFSFVPTPGQPLAKSMIQSNLISSLSSGGSLGNRKYVFNLSAKGVSSLLNQIGGVGGHDSLQPLEGSFMHEEIIEMITFIIEDGIASMDDLLMVLRLVQELGMAVPLSLMFLITDAIQVFVEEEISKISDPSKLIQLIMVIDTFSQMEVVKQLDLDFLGNKFVQLLSSISNNHEKQALIQDFSLFCLGSDSSFSIDDCGVEDIGYSHIAEQVAGSQSYKSFLPHHGRGDVPGLGLPEQHQSTSGGSMTTNVSDSLLNHSKSYKKTLKPEMVQVWTHLMKSLESLIEVNQSVFSRQMMDLIQAVYKQSLSAALDQF